MDKNTVTGLLLIALLFFIYSVWVTPPDNKNAANNADNSGTPAATTTPDTATAATPAASKPDSAAAATGLANFRTNPNLQEQLVTLENDLIKITLTNKGGRVYSAQLKNYKNFEQQPLVLLNGPGNEFSLKLPMNRSVENTQNYLFEVVKADAGQVVMRLYHADSAAYVEQAYSLKPKSYALEYNFILSGFDKYLPDNTALELDWKTNLIKQEQSLTTERSTTGIYYKEQEDDPTYLSETANDKKSISFSLDWVAFKQQFFNTTLIAQKGFKAAELAIEAPAAETDTTLEIASANLRMQYEPGAEFIFPMQLYFGPNHYKTLRSMKNGMEKMVPLGWGIFGWVNRWIIIPLFNFFSRFIGSYGLIILLLTLVIKFALFPLTYRSSMSAAKMNVLKPEMEELREKYGKDAQKLQAEQMKLYSRAGVNPLGGCLPQLLQLPILIAMYRFFPASIELRQHGFLWAKDLSTYDSILHLPFKIPFYGDHVSLFCILSAASTFIYMRMNNQMTPTTSKEMELQMKIMQNIMPVMLLFLFNNFSAGLTYYFFLSNIITYAQQYIIKRFFIDEAALHAQIQENKKKPMKQSKFQQRLEEMMKAQQDAQRQQQHKDRKK
ncbi:membrane protein insertase YidC [Sphingobacteriales bacterium UPWRP_1]|nr:membrane protein insertase YidC [Sphingobacteriales bacterium TSM_CSM]PSJ74422.1 membrane protein insertase YidC [Sphingobacteriales bacterium UPWRP_1]